MTMLTLPIVLDLGRVSIVKLIKRSNDVEELELKNLTKRNKAKTDDNGHFLPNGQSSKSGLNKSFLDAGFVQFFDILSHIVIKTGGKVVKVKPDHISKICCECDEYVPKKLRDMIAAINTKRVGVDVFPTIKRRRGKL